MADGSERVYSERRAAKVGETNPADAWIQWAREAVTIIAAAGAAYMGIRVDLARNQSDIDNLKIQAVKLENQVEKLRDAAQIKGGK